MLGTFTLGTLFGIRIRAHWLFLVLLAWGALSGGGLPWLVTIAFVFGFVVLHELGHSLTARRYGIRVRDITLTPIGGMARLEGMPPTPNAEFWIALAGPAVNIALALLIAPLVILAGAWSIAWNWNALASLGIFLRTLLIINVVLAVFNLLPAFPMDGGRILRAWLARRQGLVEATRRAAKVGRWVALGMAIVGIAEGPFLLIFIALFVYVAGKQEEWAVRLRYAQAPVVDLGPRPGQAGGPGTRGSAAPRPLDRRVVDEMLRRMKEEMRNP